MTITENIALNKPAWQQNPERLHGPERAVDGSKSDLYIYGGQCTTSYSGFSTAEWGVDLGEVLNIHHIFIQYATNNNIWGKGLKML